MKIVTVTKNLMLNPTEANPAYPDGRKIVTTNQPVDEEQWIIPGESRRVISSSDEAEVPPAEAPLPPVSNSVGPAVEDPLDIETSGGGFYLGINVHDSTIDEIKTAVGSLPAVDQNEAARWVMEQEGSRPDGPRATLLAAMGAFVA